MKKHLLLILSILTLLIGACRQEEPATPTAPPTIEVAEATVTSTTEPTPEPTTTPSPTPRVATPTPITPMLSVNDQTITDNGEVQIASVTLLNSGWVVIYADEAGEPGEILAQMLVNAGNGQAVVVTVDPFEATDTLHIVLHEDGGQMGEFEFPGPDSPINFAGEDVSTTIAIERDIVLPSIAVSDQAINRTGQVTVDSVVSPEVGWLVIQADDGMGNPGRVIGQSPLKEGLNEAIPVFFDWRNATPLLFATLYQDSGEIGLFEPFGTDNVVRLGDTDIQSSFNVTLPPDVFILQQPVINGEIVVERIVTNEPSWLVVYTDDEGSLGLVIGFIALEPGITENLTVPLVNGAETDVLYLIIHEDTNNEGEFDFPDGDLPLRYEGQQETFSFRTGAGNYVITQNQPLAEDGEIVVPLVVTDVPTWVVVRAEAEGEPGEIVGMVLVPAGIHRNLSIDVDTSLATTTLYIILHLDAGTPGEFNFPDGVDLPLQRNRAIIQAPFTITE